MHSENYTANFARRFLAMIILALSTIFLFELVASVIL